jgi:hypothetical protein
MWCRLLRDNPAERVAKAWSRAVLQQSMLITLVPDRVSQTEVMEQVSHQQIVPAPAGTGEHPVIIELARHRSEARAAVGEAVGEDRCQIVRMPVGIARDRRP